MKSKVVKGFIVVALIAVAVLGVKFAKDHNEKSVQIATGNTEVKNIDVVWDSEWDLAELKSAKKPILLDFTASWCVPCKEFNPILEQTKKELGDKVIIKIVDVDKNPELAKKFPIRVIPTQVLINADGTPFEPTEDLSIFGFLGYSKEGSKDGNDLTVHEGAMEKEQLKRLLTAMLSTEPKSLDEGK